MSIKGPFKDIDPEDIEELLSQIGNAFSIKFENNDFINVKTFGELCDVVIEKIKLENSNDCTSQQAFYKLRQAISKEFDLPIKAISTKLLLVDIFPKENRRSKIRQLETHLGFGFNLLVAPHWVTFSLLFLLLSSFPMFFFSWKIALAVLCFSVFLFDLSHRLGNHLDLDTLGELTKSITKNHYMKVRRTEGTANKQEVEEIIKDWFVEEFGMERSDLNKEVRII